MVPAIVGVDNERNELRFMMLNAAVRSFNDLDIALVKFRIWGQVCWSSLCITIIADSFQRDCWRCSCSYHGRRYHATGSAAFAYAQQNNPLNVSVILLLVCLHFQMSFIQQQLLFDVPASKVSTLSCGHVIPPSHLHAGLSCAQLV